MLSAKLLALIPIDLFVNVYSVTGGTFAVLGIIDAIVLGGSEEIALGGVGSQCGVVCLRAGGVFITAAGFHLNVDIFDSIERRIEGEFCDKGAVWIISN